jgi:hypothetical protein
MRLKIRRSSRGSALSFGYSRTRATIGTDSFAARYWPPKG